MHFANDCQISMLTVECLYRASVLYADHVRAHGQQQQFVPSDTWNWLSKTYASKPEVFFTTGKLKTVWNDNNISLYTTIRPQTSLWSGYIYAVLTAYTCKGLENTGDKENKDPLCSVPRLH